VAHVTRVARDRGGAGGRAAGATNSFNDVSCTSPTACTAVGEHRTGDIVVPLAERESG
jgi:hypothetical protein